MYLKFDRKTYISHFDDRITDTRVKHMLYLKKKQKKNVPPFLVSSELSFMWLFADCFSFWKWKFVINFAHPRISKSFLDEFFKCLFNTLAKKLIYFLTKKREVYKTKPTLKKKKKKYSFITNNFLHWSETKFIILWMFSSIYRYYDNYSFFPHTK